MQAGTVARTNVAIATAIVLQSAAVALPLIHPGAAPALRPALFLLSALLFVSGCGLYARGKGHSGWYGLLGLLSLPGLLALFFLKDRHPAPSRFGALARILGGVAFLILVFVAAGYFSLRAVIAPLNGIKKTVQKVDAEGFAIQGDPVPPEFRRLSPGEARQRLADRFSIFGSSYGAENFVRRAAFGDVAGVVLYLRSGMSPDAVDANGRTALWTVVEGPFREKQRLMVMRELLRAGANTRNRDYLIPAIRSSNLAAFQALVVSAGTVTDSAPFADALYEAARADTTFRQDVNRPYLRLLLDAGVNPNVRGRRGRSALSAAVMSANAEAATELLKAGADAHEWVNRMSLLGRAIAAARWVRTAKEDGQEERAIATVRALVQGGADINGPVYENGKTLVTPLDFASGFGVANAPVPAIADYLRAAGARGLVPAADTSALTGVIFTTALNPQNRPVDNVATIDVKAPRIYLFASWTLLPEPHALFFRITDGAGHVVHERHSQFVAQERVWNTWEWFDLDKKRAMVNPGEWRFELFLDGHRFVDEKRTAR
jgi:ankyrin repeat protein